LTVDSTWINWMPKAWEVLLLFLIPIGGGIPAGVVLAAKHGFTWPFMILLYLVSDIILAFLFEPLLLLTKMAARRFELLARWMEGFKKSMDKTISKYGVNPSPFALVMISFGVDPMTGRTAALAAGHSFLSGWAIAIAGDMIFFLILMISTLCLNSILGDGTWTAIIITVGMMAIHFIIKRFRETRAPK
jgi:hypothetical protein